MDAEAPQMPVLPDGVAPYSKTRTFTESSVPAGLLASHSTKAGVWGRITVLEARLGYRILGPPARTFELSPSQSGIVEPELLQEVEPLGAVRFYVEFHRAPRE